MDHHSKIKVSQPDVEDLLNENIITNSWFRLTIILIGGFSMFLGLATLIEWHVSPPLFFQLHSSLIPLRYHTGLAFFCSGSSFLLIGIGPRFPSMVLGGLISFMSLITTAEYLLNIDLGSSQMMPKVYSTDLTSHFGRMSFMASVAFACIGINLILMSFKVRLKRSLFTLGLLGSITISLGIVAFLGSLAGIDPGEQWGTAGNLSHSSLALYGRIGLIALGCGAIVIAWSDLHNQKSSLLTWLPTLISLAIIVGSIFLWRMLIADKRISIRKEVFLRGQAVQNEIKTGIQSYAEMLIPVTEYEKFYQGSNESGTRFDTKSFVNKFKGCKAVLWIDPSFRMHWILPFQGKQVMLDLNPKFKELVESKMRLAQEQQEMRIAEPIQLVEGSKGFLIFIPFFNAGNFSGCMSMIFDAQDFFTDSLENVALGYSISLFDIETELYRRNSMEEAYNKEWGEELKTNFFGRPWRIRIWPTKEVLEEQQTDIPKWVLTAGLMIAVLTFLVIRRIQITQFRTSKFQKMNEALQAEIIERKQIEDSLRQSRERFKILLEQAADAIFLIDAKGNFIEVNRCACKGLGYTREELLHLSLVNIEVNFESSKISDILKRKTANEKITLKGLHRRKDGSVFPVDIHVGILEVEGRILFLALVRDTTERYQVEEALRVMPRRILEAQEAERRRVAGELHDGVNQLLASVRFRIRSLETKISRHHDKLLVGDAMEANKLLEDALEKVRKISHSLRPSELDDLGLLSAIRSACDDFEERTNLKIDLNLLSITEVVSPEISLVLYRIVQESLVNIEKHAQATKVSLCLELRTSFIVLRVKDNGRGFIFDGKIEDQKKIAFGLVNMYERVIFLGGFFEIISSPNRGTEIIAKIPLNELMENNLNGNRFKKDTAVTC